MRAIDAENIRIKPEFMHNVCGMAMIRVEDVVRILNDQPTIQPKKGTWIDTKGNAEWYAREYECSECGGTMLGESNFCPNCGAEMEVTE